MLAKHYRMTRGELDTLFRNARRVSGQHLMLLVREAPSRKAAVVVGKKVVRGAVARNALRRRIYEHLRQFGWYAGMPAYHMAVMVRRGIHDSSRDTLLAELNQLLAGFQQR